MLTAGAVTYGYDNNGNQTSRASDTFTYDHENRLMETVISGATSSSVYNGDGMRISHTVGGTPTSYAWDIVGGLPLVLQDGVNTYLYGLDLISATDGAGNQTYFTYDGLGSTTDLTDSSATKTDGYSYDAFGAATHSPGTSANAWLFTGEQTDADSGLQFLRARYYDTGTGRFLGVDPIGAAEPYAYVGSNPVNFVDPYGLFGFKDIKDAAGEVVESTYGTFGPPYNLIKVATILDILPTQLACGIAGGALGSLTITPFGMAAGAAGGVLVCEVVFGVGSAIGSGRQIYKSDCSDDRKAVAGLAALGNAALDAPYLKLGLVPEMLLEGALATGMTAALDCGGDTGGNGGKVGPNSGNLGGPGGNGGGNKE